MSSKGRKRLSGPGHFAGGGGACLEAPGSDMLGILDRGIGVCRY
jgi:hypothetical protein